MTINILLIRAAKALFVDTTSFKLVINNDISLLTASWLGKLGKRVLIKIPDNHCESGGIWIFETKTFS